MNKESFARVEQKILQNELKPGNTEHDENSTISTQKILSMYSDSEGVAKVAKVDFLFYTNTIQSI